MEPHKMDVTVYRVGRDRIVMVGDPDTAEDHNCDYMGCGQEHVVGRAVLAKSHDDDDDWRSAWERAEAMLSMLQLAIEDARKPTQRFTRDTAKAKVCQLLERVPLAAILEVMAFVEAQIAVNSEGTAEQEEAVHGWLRRRSPKSEKATSG
jgi:hypothetical protein